MIAVNTREDGLRVAILGLIGFAMIFPLCTWKHVQPIEADLLSRCSEVLASESLASLDLVVSGRDVSLTGVVKSQEQRLRILDKVASVRGVRVVRDNTTLKTRFDEAGGSG